MIDLTLDDYRRCVELITTYADLGLGQVDASVIVLAENQGITTIATLNHRDFAVVRPRHVEGFDLIPCPGTRLLSSDARPSLLSRVRAGRLQRPDRPRWGDPADAAAGLKDSLPVTVAALAVEPIRGVARHRVVHRRRRVPAHPPREVVRCARTVGPENTRPRFQSPLASVGGRGCPEFPDRRWHFGRLRLRPRPRAEFYVNGDPLNFNDPNGHRPACDPDVSCAEVYAAYRQGPGSAANQLAAGQAEIASENAYHQQTLTDTLLASLTSDPQLNNPHQNAAQNAFESAAQFYTYYLACQTKQYADAGFCYGYDAQIGAVNRYFKAGGSADTLQKIAAIGLVEDAIYAKQVQTSPLQLLPILATAIPGVGDVAGPAGEVIEDVAGLGAEDVAAGGPRLALGLSRSPATQDALLKPFADSIGAQTWTDPAFNDLVELRQSGASWETISEKIIDRTVANGGTLHFNLAELDPAAGGVTAHELQYILDNPTLNGATTFYGGTPP